MFSIDVINLTRNEIICLVTRLLSIIRALLSTRANQWCGVFWMYRDHCTNPSLGFQYILCEYCEIPRTEGKRYYVYHFSHEALMLNEE